VKALNEGGERLPFFGKKLDMSGIERFLSLLCVLRRNFP
jgi:hypothetical protein